MESPPTSYQQPAYQAPSSYPPPPPSYPPPQAYYPPPVPANKTKEGVRNIYLGMIAVIAYSALEFLSILPGLSLVACFSGLIGLLALILILLGLWKVNEGKKEYPEPHPSMVGKAMTFLILVIVMFVVTSIASAGAALSSIDFSSLASDTPEVSISLKNTIMVATALSIVTNLFVGLMFKSLIDSLASPEARERMKLATALLVVSAIVSLVLVVAFYPSGPIDLEDPPVEASISAAGGLVAILGYLVFMLVYKETHERIERGELKPQPMGAQHGAPAYPSYPPPPPQGGNYPPPPP